MLKTVFKKADIILLAVLITVGIFASAALARTGKNGSEVVISRSGKEIGRYALDSDLSVLVEGSQVSMTVPADQDIIFEEMPKDYNIVTIRGGEVSVREADCRYQVCVDHKPIRKTGESIICLPHRLVIEIISDKNDGDYDTLAQ